MPKGFAKDQKAAEYLKFKNYLASCEISPTEIGDVKKIASQIKLMKSLNDFLRKAMK